MFIDGGGVTLAMVITGATSLNLKLYWTVSS
jgi:hypothetical protein